MARVGAVRSNGEIVWGRRWGDTTRPDRRRTPRPAEPRVEAALPVTLEPIRTGARAPLQRPVAALVTQLLAPTLENPHRRNARPDSDLAEAAYAARQPVSRHAAPGAILRRDA
jgi:hypothetical protein